MTVVHWTPTWTLKEAKTTQQKLYWDTLNSAALQMHFTNLTGFLYNNKEKSTKEFLFTKLLSTKVQTMLQPQSETFFLYYWPVDVFHMSGFIYFSM